MIDILDKIFKNSIGLSYAEFYSTNTSPQLKQDGIKKFLLSYSAWQSDDLLNFMPEMKEQVKQLDEIQVLKEAKKKLDGNYSRVYEPDPHNRPAMELKNENILVEEINWQGRILSIFLITLALNVGYSIYRIYDP